MIDEIIIPLTIKCFLFYFMKYEDCERCSKNTQFAYACYSFFLQSSYPHEVTKIKECTLRLICQQIVPGSQYLNFRASAIRL